jgi:hypothetical protein
MNVTKSGRVQPPVDDRSLGGDERRPVDSTTEEPA